MCAAQGKSGSGAGGHLFRVARIDQDRVGFIQTLPTLRRTAHRGVDALCIAGKLARQRAQFALFDGIADADIHA